MQGGKLIFLTSPSSYSPEYVATTLYSVIILQKALSHLSTVVIYSFVFSDDADSTAVPNSAFLIGL